MESKGKSVDGNSFFFSSFSCSSPFLFFGTIFFFFFLSFSLGDNGLLTKGMELVGEFIKVINAFTIVQNWCSWGECVAWELLSPI